MKKTLLMVIALVLVLALTAGCGNNSGGSQDDPGTVDEPVVETGGDSGTGGGDVLGWPAADLPPGLPVYPGGALDYLEIDDEGMVYLVIIETDKAEFDKYFKTLEEAGWTETRREDIPLNIEMMKDNFWMGLSFSDPDTALMAVAMLDVSLDTKDWPEGLPYPLPEYTSGTISIVNVKDDSLMIDIDNTSRVDYDKYLDAVAAAGWELSSSIEDYSEVTEVSSSFKREGWILLVDYHKDNYISIYVSVPANQ